MYTYFLLIIILSFFLFREDSELTYQFKSMLLSVFFQSFLFITQLLIAVNIDTSSMPWSVTLSPLFLLPFFSVPSCLWNCYRKRSYEVSNESLYIFTILYTHVYILYYILYIILYTIYTILYTILYIYILCTMYFLYIIFMHIFNIVDFSVVLIYS